MKRCLFIWPLFFLLCFSQAGLRGQITTHPISVDFYGDTLYLEALVPAIPSTPSSPPAVSEEAVKTYFDAINSTAYTPIVNTLLQYRNDHQLDDWLYYQLIRKTVQVISPKEVNYERYTVYKWFLLIKSGYGATLKIGNGRLMFYVQTNEDIFNLPWYMRNGRQYVCLNYHDYQFTGNEKELLAEVNLGNPESLRSFTYKVTQLPGFKPADYIEKELRFSYYNNDYHFNVKVNTEIKKIFANYPVVDFELYFNIPLSKETYQSLIPALKKNIAKMKTRDGVDYLMRFTRYAFLFETDMVTFGGEKRLSPEQTLLFDQSDCEDRAGLFFYLVKEIYDLPMIVLSFPQHITIAVKFDKPVGKPITYNGQQYTICEPTPQRDDLSIGKLIPSLNKKAYEVVYAYVPEIK